MRIKAIGPNSGRTYAADLIEEKVKFLQRYASPGTEIDMVYPDAPPDLGGSSIRKGWLTEANTETLGPWVAKEAIKAEREGFDGILLTGQFNVGAGITRHVVNIPVIDSATATLHVAALIGDRICVLIPWKNTNSYARRLFKRWGMSEFVTSIKSWDMPPDKNKKKEIRERTISLCKMAVEEEDAHVIVPLCGPFIPTLFEAPEIEAEVGVPVLDTWAVGVKMTEMFINLKISTSQTAYPYTKIDLGI